MTQQNQGLFEKLKGFFTKSVAKTEAAAEVNTVEIVKDKAVEIAPEKIVPEEKVSAVTLDVVSEPIIDESVSTTVESEAKNEEVSQAESQEWDGVFSNPASAPYDEPSEVQSAAEQVVYEWA